MRENLAVSDPNQTDPLDTGGKESASGGESVHLAPTLPPSSQKIQASAIALPVHENVGRARMDSFAPGMLIAEKYVVERVLGEGGIGVVVAAKHVDLGQTVAIKYLRPQALTGGGNAADRFLREARLAAKIRSDHVVHVYDVGRLPDGSPYMVMEYLAGTDLGRLLLANGPLPLDRAIDYVLQTCEALAEAHVAGVVHRDLKPDNLFVTTANAGKSVVKILDFGISKLSAKRTTEHRLDALTEPDDRFGTPVYMSPEQLRASRDVDARSDVWAVGVVLYELLTGCLPFDGDGLPELCTAILTLPPVPLTKHRPYLPDTLQTVIERCLRKEPEERFQNVAELAQELRLFATPAAQERIDHVINVIREAGEPIGAPTPPPGAVSSTPPPHQATTLGPAETRVLLTTGSAAASWRGVLREVSASRWTRRRLLIAGTALLALVALIGVGIGFRQPADRATATTMGPPPEVVAVPSFRADPAEAPVVSLASEVSREPPPPPSPSPAGAAAGAHLHGHPKMSPSASASAGHPQKPAPASSAFDSTGVINPFE
jgi:serine/threonine protein kinase